MSRHLTATEVRTYARSGRLQPAAAQRWAQSHLLGAKGAKGCEQCKKAVAVAQQARSARWSPKKKFTLVAALVGIVVSAILLLKLLSGGAP